MSEESGGFKERREAWVLGNSERDGNAETGHLTGRQEPEDAGPFTCMKGVEITFGAMPGQ